MDDLGLAVFAKLCGANRGAFVLDPPDGTTYGCTSLPPSFSTDAGLTSPIPDSANLTQSFSAGNVTAEATVEIVDSFVRAVYSTSLPGAADNPYACDVNGLATLSNCANSDDDKKGLLPDGEAVRAVTLAGAFVPAPWATGGKILTTDEAKEFYSSKDFREMASLGVNAVQIPVPCDAFVDLRGEVAKTVSKLLDRASRAGLSAVLVLAAPDDDAEDADEEEVEGRVEAAAAYAAASSTVVALQLPSSRPSLVSAARSASTDLAVLVPANKGQLGSLSLPPDDNLYAALDVGATTDVAGVASSDSEGDRMKMFYHESITCIDRSPIEWLACYRDTPVYVTSGFDLAVDDCIREDEEDFRDYGQCDRFDETIGSGWWARHRTSLAGRMLFAYSRGLGFSFSGWKLYGADGDATTTAAGGGIEAPANLLCLRDVAAAGLLPDLSVAVDAGAACLNGPVADFAMGDETYAPTPAPHDCGEGWWNATTEVCDYWIPPPPEPKKTDYGTLIMGAVGGAVGALFLNWLLTKMRSRDQGYESLP